MRILAIGLPCGLPGKQPVGPQQQHPMNTTYDSSALSEGLVKCIPPLPPRPAAGRQRAPPMLPKPPSVMTISAGNGIRFAHRRLMV